ncbi:proliferating cell nuclear antigen [Klebsormidium nitens]|uniref:Proliferating cell nuclear antigen n=1 Tax=Klebsormidium nitens TaxID=105231 RepID=A0A1Y1I7I7_KLENI|nr:proliferating cell nuclear antigen [Klebsormidium nitens]|eukprot:GAQ85101.1 proliferating cell nuclear antigen [Klebsormidium nitens]
MDNVLYFHPRCAFSKDLINGVRRIPSLAANLRTVDGSEAFRWLSSLPTRGGEGAASDGAPGSSETRPAVECSRHADSSTLRFVDFNAEHPSVTMAPEWYCSF